MRKIVIVFIIGLLIWNCKKDELMFYEGPETIRFDVMDVVKNVTDTGSFSFGLTNVYDTVYRILVRATGEVRAYPRTFEAEIIGTKFAEKGRDFDIAGDFEIQANSNYGYIPVKLYRGSDTDDTLRSITFSLKSNENFTAEALPYWFNGKSQNDTVNVKNFTIQFTSDLTRPDAWMESGWFGYFSLDKFILLNTLVNLSPQDWVDFGRYPPLPQAYGYINTLENYLLIQLSKGYEYAVKDNSSYARQHSKGYMTMKMYNESVVIPEDWPTWPDDFQ